jgi:TonB-linked SusC/RagA family outer membrane protein
MRKFASLLATLMLFCALAYGQARTVTGTVRDEKGEPIPFATVTEAGTRNAVQADANGNFSIKLADNGRLTISATGFTAQTITPTGNTTSVALASNGAQMQEVVVTALGIQRQRKELGYSTARIDNQVLTQAAPVNVANGLQGKVSGVNITTVNNSVFGDVKINLRGIRSLTLNNNPLLLVDGVQTPINILSTLNPNDIQEVTVLKGSSAAGVYGSDARNGVIVVTTKKGGLRGGAPTINVSHTTQLESISFFPKFQTQFGSGGYGSYIPYENWSWGPAFDGQIREVGRHLEDGSFQELPYSYLPNEKRDFFNTGITNQTDVSFGVKDFYIGLQDVRINGIVPDDRNRRTSIRLNTAREYGRFRAGFNLNYIQQNYNIFDQNQMQDYQFSQNVGLNGGLMNLIFNTPGNIPITAYKDFRNNKFADYNGYFNDYGLNPYFAIDNWRQTGKVDNFLGTLELGFKAASWLNFTYRANTTIISSAINGTSKGEVPSTYAANERSFKTIPGTANYRSDRDSRITSEFFANFDKTFGDFRVNAIAGHFFRQNDFRRNVVGASNLVVPELFNVGNRTGELVGSNSTSRTRLIAAFGSASVTYKGFATVEFSGRNEWTSVLPSNNNSYFFPTVNASVVLTDAIPSLRNNFLSYLKLRASWNRTGSADIGAYLLEPTFGQASGFPYGTLAGFTANNTAYDPNLKPEFTTSKEVGFEASFLRNRINFEAAYFHQDNTDQIISIRIPDATGYSNLFTNAGAFINRGFEMDLKLTPLVRLGKFNFDLNANATYNNSEVTRIAPGLDRIFIGGFDNFAANYAVVGQPAFVFLLTDYKRDDQGRVIINPTSGYPDVDPNVKQFGRTQPLWVAGISPRLSYKGLSFTVVGEYRGGHYAYHNIGPDMAWTGISAATAINNRERFVFPNSSYLDNTGKYVANTDIAVSNVNDFFTGVYRDVATNFLTSADSWRIREVSLSYNLPENLLRPLRVVKGATLTLNARNLFLWVPKTNEYSDPDFNFTTGNASGVGTAQITPPTRVYGATLNVRF